MTAAAVAAAAAAAAGTGALIRAVAVALLRCSHVLLSVRRADAIAVAPIVVAAAAASSACSACVHMLNVCRGADICSCAHSRLTGKSVSQTQESHRGGKARSKLQPPTWVKCTTSTVRKKRRLSSCVVHSFYAANSSFKVQWHAGGLKASAGCLRHDNFCACGSNKFHRVEGVQLTWLMCTLAASCTAPLCFRPCLTD